MLHCCSVRLYIPYSFTSRTRSAFDIVCLTYGCSYRLCVVRYWLYIEPSRFGTSLPSPFICVHFQCICKLEAIRLSHAFAFPIVKEFPNTSWYTSAQSSPSSSQKKKSRPGQVTNGKESFRLGAPTGQGLPQWGCGSLFWDLGKHLHVSQRGWCIYMVGTTDNDWKLVALEMRAWKRCNCISTTWNASTRNARTILVILMMIDEPPKSTFFWYTIFVTLCCYTIFPSNLTLALYWRVEETTALHFRTHVEFVPLEAPNRPRNCAALCPARLGLFKALSSWLACSNQKWLHA